jgi:hypothetical protein
MAADETDWMRLSSSVVLDGGDTGRVLTFDDFEDDRSVVSGFTIQNGNGGMGGGIYCYDTAAPTIIHNIIKNNHATAAGGGIFVHNGAAMIKNNLIIDNSSGNWGGGIYAGSGTMICNTIYGNTAEGGGGGLYYNYGTPTICNNILWGNSSTVGGQQIAYLTNPPPSVVYSNIQGGWTGEGNIDQDPMFVDPANGDFTLMPGSPCIDAGDPSLPNDPDGTTADMGAFAFFDPMDAPDGTDGSQLPETFNLAQNYPNPFNPATTITYSVPERSHVTVDVFNVLGQRVRTLIDREQAAGSYTVTWDGADDRGTALATGVYLYRFRAGDYIETRKMLLMK